MNSTEPTPKRRERPAVPPAPASEWDVLSRDGVAGRRPWRRADALAWLDERPEPALSGADGRAVYVWGDVVRALRELRPARRAGRPLAAV